MCGPVANPYVNMVWKAMQVHTMHLLHQNKTVTLSEWLWFAQMLCKTREILFSPQFESHISHIL